MHGGSRGQKGEGAQSWRAGGNEAFVSDDAHAACSVGGDNGTCIYEHGREVRDMQKFLCGVSGRVGRAVRRQEDGMGVIEIILIIVEIFTGI